MFRGGIVVICVRRWGFFSFDYITFAVFEWLQLFLCNLRSCSVITWSSRQQSRTNSNKSYFHSCTDGLKTDPTVSIDNSENFPLGFEKKVLFSSYESSFFHSPVVERFFIRIHWRHLSMRECGTCTWGSKISRIRYLLRDRSYAKRRKNLPNRSLAAHLIGGNGMD